MGSMRPDGGIDATQNAMFPTDYYAASGRWAAKTVSAAADRYKVLSPADGGIKIAGTMYYWTSQQTLDLSLAATWDTVAGTDYRTAANRAGKDFYVYACQPGSGTTPIFLVSANSSAPSGYTTSTSRQIAGFHGLCLAVNHESTLTAWAADTVIALGETRKSTVWNGKIIRCTARANDFKTDPTTEPNVAAAAVGAVLTDDQITWVVIQHALEGYATGDILPASVWDLRYRPSSSPAGMVYGNGTWIDIYLSSSTGASLASVYGATVTHNRLWRSWMDDMKAVGKQFPRQHVWMLATIGSNENSAIAGAGDPLTTGGNSDSYGRRMISDIGCEDMVGHHKQFAGDYWATNAITLGGHGAGGNACGLNYTSTFTYLTPDTTISARGCAPMKVWG